VIQAIAEATRQTTTLISEPLGQTGLRARVVLRLVCSQLVYSQT